MTNSNPECWYSDNRYSEDNQNFHQGEISYTCTDSSYPTLQSNPNATNTMTSSTSTMHSKSTPPRHNYHNPHTPIASIKRPRSTLIARHRSSSSSNSNSITGTPRAPADVTTPMSVTTPHAMTPYSSAATPARASSSSAADETPLSPMHGVKPVKPGDIHDVPQQQEQQQQQQQAEQRKSWVGQKVDALFSPVYQFLHHEEEEQKLKDLQDEEEGRIMMDTTSEDKDLDNDTQPTNSVSSSESSNETPNKSTTQDSDCDDDVDGEYHDAQDDYQSDSDDDGDDDDASMGRPVQPTDLDEFNPWQFIKSLPPYQSVIDLVPKVTLPPKAPGTPDKTLVLDLDETLVHCTVETPETPADLTFPVAFHGVTYTVHVRLRPFLQTFLERIKGKFEVIVFTASQKVYADELLNLIDPKGIYIQHRLFRESCLAVDGNFLKDLNVLGRDLSKTVLVDNSPHAFGYQVDNGIPIESWFDCPSDRELLKLERFLRTLKDVDDVRPVVKRKFQAFKLIQNAPSLYG